MAAGEKYSRAIEVAWEVINIYDSPEVFFQTFEQVQREIGLLYAAHLCQSEICNGGFDQFFWNSTGVLAPEAVEGFEGIGQAGIAQLLRRATALWGECYERDRDRRQAALDSAPAELLSELDNEFFKLIRSESGGFEVAADQYAAKLSRS